MADIKDKVVTAESLKALHDYNKETYITKTDIIPMGNGGTGADSGDLALQNLFADGWTVLSPYQYGDELPEACVPGRIFFKRLTDV